MGASTFAGAIVSVLFLAQVGTGHSGNVGTITGLAVTAGVLIIAFHITEAYVAVEPIFLLRLFRNKDIVYTYLVVFFQMLAQSMLMFFTPLSFQVNLRGSPSSAGVWLIPAVIGNGVGRLVAGAMIKRSGRFKTVAVSAGLIGSVAYVSVLVRWNGNTNWWESLYIAPGGFGTSALTAVFVGITAAVKQEELVMGISGLFLVINLAMLASITIANGLFRLGFRAELIKNVMDSNASQVGKTSQIDCPTQRFECSTDHRRITVGCVIY